MKRIALWMGLLDYYDHGIARGIVRYAKARPDWQLYGFGWMFSPLERLENWTGDGVIARIEYAEDAQAVNSLACPVVDVANAFAMPGTERVANDDREAGRIAARYFSDNGYSSFAYCGVSSVVWSWQRLEGFCEKTGSSAPAVFERPLRWWLSEHHSDQLAAFLKALPKPTALFSCNDKVGLRVAVECRKEGIGVPEDIAIVGVDNEDVICELANPSLSSMVLQLEELGMRAAARLDALMSDTRDEATLKSIDHLVAPGEIVERKSSSAYVSSNAIIAAAFRLIRDDHGHLLTVNDLVRQLPVGRRTLEINFSREIGHTVHEAIVAQKVRVAGQLLRSTNLTVETVAKDAGFGSVQRFFAQFRRHTGTTPAKYRSRVRQ